MPVILLIINYLLHAFELILLVRVILSWVVSDARNSIYNFVVAVTEPALAPIRRILEKSQVTRNMPFDLSPIFVFLLIELIRRILFRAL